MNIHERMAYANVGISIRKDSAQDKIAVMEVPGIHVSPSPAKLRKTLVEVLKDAKN